MLASGLFVRYGRPNSRGCSAHVLVSVLRGAKDSQGESRGYPSRGSSEGFEWARGRFFYFWAFCVIFPHKLAERNFFNLATKLADRGLLFFVLGFGYFSFMSPKIPVVHYFALKFWVCVVMIGSAGWAVFCVFF